MLVNEFKAGEYIVTLEVAGDYFNCAKDNYCFKQRRDDKYIVPCMDLSGSDTNGHGIFTFDKKEKLLDWRYATQREIEEYDRLNEPYNVTKIQNNIYECW